MHCISALHYWVCWECSVDRLSFQEKGNVRDLMSALYGCNTLLGVCALYGCNTLFGMWSVVWIGFPSKMSLSQREIE